VSWPEPGLVLEAAEPWLAEPELPPAAVAAPVILHPPVTAAELPPLDAPAKKTPFWKKELSVSRKPKTEKTPKAEKAARAPKEKGAPFWKKELSLGRKPKAAALEAPTEQLPVVAKTPLLKRKLSLSVPKLPSRGGAKGGHGSKKVVGLKIGASQLAAARISNNGVAELQQLAREPLAAGVIVAGELRDPEALGDALKVFFARHKLPKKGVRLGIASNRIGVRILEIVGVEEEKQLANAVQFRAQEALPIPLDEAVLDYRVLEESVDAEGQKVKRVLLVVAYRELVDRYVSACRKAGINLAGIDLEAFALLRALGAPADREGSALVAVAIGHDRSTFAVSDGRICEFTRVVEWGGSALNVALARAFDSTPSEVETMKRSLSLDGTTTSVELTPEQTTVALEAVRRQLQSFARELVSSLQFYQNQPGSLGIGEIVLTGGTAHLPGLAEELERLIGVHVRIGDPFARLKVSKRFSGTEQIGSLAVAIGLGIED
jgi:type IV pilus assembly protein PilM